jgi:hypothetical protein
LDEPWDSEHNQKLIDQMPMFYRNPSARPSSSHASYLLPTGPGSIFEGTEGTAMRSITDGLANTILAVEVNDEAAVPWTKPEDLKYDPETPLTGLGAAHPGGFLAAFADGSVRFVSQEIDLKLFLALLKKADGQAVGRF